MKDTTETEIRTSLYCAYKKIVNWKKKFMKIPRGNGEKTLISPVSCLIGLYCKKWESV